MPMSELIVNANEDRLSLEVEYDAKKYKYRNRIHDADELGYLVLRLNSYTNMNSVKNILAEEFSPL
jgi:hypothetical protein